VRKALAAAVALAAAALLFAACGERAEPTGARVPTFPVTVDNGADGELTLRSQPQRLAVLDPDVAAILEALGAGGLIVPMPPQRAQEASALRSAHPDLLIASTAIDTPRLDRARAATGVAAYVAPLDSYAGLKRAVHDLGLLAGQPLAGRRLVERLVAAQARVD